MSPDMNRSSIAAGRRWNRHLLHTLGISASLLALGGLSGAGEIGGSALTARAAPTARSTVRAPAMAYVRNPHLHVAVHDIHRGRAVHRHRLWRHRWHYHTWVTSHRGLGMIEGIVHDSHGRPVPNAVVELKQSNGHSFHHAGKRHTTRTNSSGAFVMTGVRAGHYRIASHKSKSHGHVHLVVHTGAMATAQIKI